MHCKPDASFKGYRSEIQSSSFVVVAVARGTSLALSLSFPLKALVGNDQIGIYAALSLFYQSSPQGSPHQSYPRLGLFEC